MYTLHQVRQTHCKVNTFIGLKWSHNSNHPSLETPKSTQTEKQKTHKKYLAQSPEILEDLNQFIPGLKHTRSVTLCFLFKSDLIYHRSTFHLQK